MSAFERTTRRLRLRRPRADDLAGYVELHGDPRTYAHAPHTQPTPERCAERLDGDLRNWERHGFGYLAVEDLVSGVLIGWAGVTPAPPDPPLNLYYRLRHASLGLGLGRELAQGVLEGAVEELPERRITAHVQPGNAASLATARAVGMTETGTAPHEADPPDAPPYVVFEAPHFDTTTTFQARLRAEVVDLWLRVTEAGGAVGFRPGAARADVERALAAQETALAGGLAVAGLLRAPTGALLGVGFWVRGDWWGHEHVLTLSRLMVDPERQRRGTGRLLLSGLHGLARRQPDVELWRLQYRSGLGVGEFYAGLGWVETGRQPHGLRIAADDRRDDVSMARRPDGSALVYDART